MPRFRDGGDFGPTIDAAADQLGISPTAVEKDYWVSEVLRGLASAHRDDFIFKGGTSLSKGYGILQRFSEDIDILVLPGGRGRAATDTLMKHMGDAAAASTGGEALAVGRHETGRHLSYAVTYPATREPTAVISTRVLLEMGVRGGPQPNEKVSIRCLVGDLLEAAGTELSEFSDLEPFEVTALHPGRTLLEKLVLIHGLSQQITEEPETQIRQRDGRHFYDVFQLLGDDRVREMLADRDQVDEVMANVEDVTLRYFAGHGLEVRPAGGFADCPAFHAGSPQSLRFRQVYESSTPELHFGNEELPAWDAICARIHDSRNLL